MATKASGMLSSVMKMYEAEKKAKRIGYTSSDFICPECRPMCRFVMCVIHLSPLILEVFLGTISPIIK